MTVNADKPDFKIGIVGTGTMGRGIVQVAAAAGLYVTAFDARPSAAAEAKDFVGKMLARQVEKKRLAAADAESAINRIEATETLDTLADCDMVMEVITEDLARKRELFTQLDQLVRPEAILATNTSSLAVTAIAAACTRPERVAGFHFFNPVPLMKLVEVIAGMKTDAWVTETLTRLARRFGHEPVLVRDSPGFLVNHVGRAYMPEALRILSECIARPEVIDQAMRVAAGFRMGPFELLDLVGLDVAHPVMESIYGQYYQEPMYQPSPLTRLRMAGGVLGRKSGAGFYEYHDGKPRIPNDNPPTTAHRKPLWVSRARPDGHAAVAALLDQLRITAETGARPSADALCVVTPIGRDTTTTATAEDLDPRRTVALDTLFPLAGHRTIMVTPATVADYRDAARAMFSVDGVNATVINDSPGFIAPRIVAMIINVGCNVAQQGIASPADIDKATRLGLNYPLGPLEWGDKIGAKRVVEILEALHQFYGEPRYRPMPWLKRRALLGMSLRELQS
ncbi:MAG: 3-hydroxyacyl-CoA dehydrogenase [Candidimonas sp.]|nr:MAG: 3-hydroxyacyl-CoA dehydrogenase [Candidimonas sp.]